MNDDSPEREGLRTKDSMTWRPASEYQPVMGRVLVWLQWLEYSGRSMGTGGTWMIAYRMGIEGGSVWVDEPNCSPIESGGRRVTHFLQPQEPRL